MLGITWSEQYSYQNLFSQLEQRISKRHDRPSQGILGVSQTLRRSKDPHSLVTISLPGDAR